MKLSKRLSRIEINQKYNGYQLELFKKTFRFFRHVWKNDDKPKKGKEKMDIVTYNFIYPNGNFNLTTVWSQKKGDYWEKDGKINYLKFSKKRIIIGKLSLLLSLENSRIKSKTEDYKILEEN
jgi:hypothetical protein